MSGAARTPGRVADDGPRRVRDPDESRSKAVDHMLATLGAGLGVDLDRVTVDLDADATAAARARGAKGLASGHAVQLDGTSFNPASADSRYVLAHEMAHVAQRNGSVSASTEEAEREARLLGTAFVEGWPLYEPQRRAAGHEPAADTGAADQPPVGFREYREAFASLVGDVRVSRAREIDLITDQLDGLWISDRDVDRVMTILEELEPAVAAAVVRQLGTEMRVALVDNIKGGHQQEFPSGVLSAYGALLPHEVRANFDGEDLFEHLSVRGLRGDLRVFALMTLTSLGAEKLAELRAGAREDPWRQDVVDFMSQRGEGLRSAIARLDEAREQEQQRRGHAESLDDDPESGRLLARLERLLEDPSREDALAAVRILGRHGPQPAEPAVDAAEAEAAAEGGGGAAPEPEPEAAGEQAEEGAVAEDPTFQFLLERLERQGAIDRLIEAVDRPWELEDQRAAFMAVIRHRPVDANLATVEELLSDRFWIFSWVDEREARYAYEILSVLPLAVRDRFMRRDGGRLLHRLETSLSREFVTGAEFRSLGVGMAGGQLAEYGDGSAEALPVVTEIIALLEQGLTPARAGIIYGKLTGLDGDALTSAVQRLDAIGELDEILVQLPPVVLLSDDNLELVGILAARHAGNVIRQLRELMANGVFHFVRAREARLAFLLFRVLRVEDRDRLGVASEIFAEMSVAMRASSGLHLLDPTSSVSQRLAVRERLGDERLWQSDRARELRVLVNMAVALGDRAWVFARSQEHQIYRLPELATIVDRFELYDPRGTPPLRPEFRPGIFERGETDDQTDLGGFLRMLGAGLWLAVRGAFQGDLVANPFSRTSRVRADLGEVQDILGGDLFGARVAETSEEGEPVAADVVLTSDEAAGTITIDLPQLELASVGRIGSGWSAHTGRVVISGLHVTVQEARGGTTPSTRLDANAITAQDVLTGSTERLRGASRVHATGLGLSTSGSVSTLPAEEFGGVGVPVIGPIIDWFRLLWHAASQSTTRVIGALFDAEGIQVSFDTLDIEGLSLAPETQVASIHVAGATLSWGRTRGEYLRRLIATLTTRLEQAESSEEQDRTRGQLAEAQAEYDEMRPRDVELHRLLQRYRTDPDSFSVSDHRRVLELQEQGPGGLILDSGSITVSGVGGAISAREVTIERLRGQGTSAGLTAGLLTDPAFIEHFLREGPLESSEAGTYDDARMVLDMGQVTATEIAIEAEIPSVERLTLERDQLTETRASLAGADPESPVLDRMDRRLGQLGTLIERRTELDRLTAARQPSAADRQRRMELYTELARHFGVTVESLTLGGVSADVDLATGRLAMEAGTAEAVGVESDAFGIQRVTGTRVRGALVFTPGVAGIQGLPASGSQIPDLGADTLDLHGVRVGAMGEISDISATNIDGRMTRVDANTWRVEDFRIESLSLRTIDLAIGAGRVTSVRPVILNSVDLDATMRTETDDNGRSRSIYTIERLSIGVVRLETPATPQQEAAETEALNQAGFDAAHLIYDDPVVDRRVEVTSGALRGVTVSGVTFRQTDSGYAMEMPDNTEFAGIQGFDALQFTASFGDTLTSGNLSSSSQDARQALAVQYAEDGSTVLDLQDLVLTGGEVRTPDGGVRIRRASLETGRVTMGDGSVQLSGIVLPEVVLDRVDWQTQDGATITADGETRLERVRLTAGIRSDALGVASATVTELRIDRITAESLTYENGPILVAIRESPAEGIEPLEIVDIHLTGLDWRRDEGVVAGNLEVESAAAEFAVSRARTLLASGYLRAEAISVGFLPGERIQARSERLDADIEVPSLGAAISVTDADTGLIEISPNSITVGVGGAPGLHVPLLQVHTLDFSSGDLSVVVNPPGGIDLTELRAAFTMDLAPPGTEPRISRVTIHEATLDQLGVSATTITHSTYGELRLVSSGRAVLEGMKASNVVIEPAGSSWEMTGFNEFFVRQTTLTNAEVTVEIARILAARAAAAPAGGAGSSPSLHPFAPMFEHVNGNINLELVLPVDVTVPGTSTTVRVDNVHNPFFPIQVAITDGQVDLRAIEDQAFDHLYDTALDFEMDGGDLVLELDPKEILAAIGAAAGAAAGGRIGGLPGAAVGTGLGGAVGFGGGVYAKTPILRWSVTTLEADALWWDLNFDAAFPGPANVSLFSMTQFSVPSGGASSGVTVHTSLIELNNIDVDLSMTNPAPVPIAIPPYGRFVLSAGALGGLTADGDVHATGPETLDFTLGHLNLDSADLTFPSLPGLRTVETGAVSLSDVTDGELDFNGFDPQRMSATVGTFGISDLRITGKLGTSPAASAVGATAAPLTEASAEAPAEAQAETPGGAEPERRLADIGAP